MSNEFSSVNYLSKQLHATEKATSTGLNIKFNKTQGCVLLTECTDVSTKHNHSGEAHNRPTPDTHRVFFWSGRSKYSALTSSNLSDACVSEKMLRARASLLSALSSAAHTLKWKYRKVFFILAASWPRGEREREIAGGGWARCDLPSKKGTK